MLKYDVVILGAGVAGCALAAQLGKAGKRVLITDPAAEPGGRSASVELQGARFSGWPTCTYGFEEGGAWDTLLRQLSLPQSAAGPGVSYQVALPGRRITVSPDTSATLEELRREYPSEIDRLRTFYRDADNLAKRMSRSRMFAYLATRRKAEHFLRSYRFSRELRAFFSASSAVFFGRSVQEASLAQLILLVTTPPRIINEGYDGIAGKLCDLLVRQGGDCRFGEPWPELHVRGSRLEGVQTAHERIDLRPAVLNVPWRFREKAFFSLVREDVVPVGMLDTVLLVRDYERPGEPVVLSLDAPIPTRSVRPLKAFFSSGAGQDTSSEDLIGALSKVVPFLADFIEASVLRDGEDRTIHIPHADMQNVHQRTHETGLPVRSPVRHLHVLEDTAFGAARLPASVRALAVRLT